MDPIFLFSLVVSFFMVTVGLMLALVTMPIKIVAIPLFVLLSVSAMVITVKKSLDGYGRDASFWIGVAATLSCAAYMSGVLQETSFFS